MFGCWEKKKDKTKDKKSLPRHNTSQLRKTLVFVASQEPHRKRGGILLPCDVLQEKDYFQHNPIFFIIHPRTQSIFIFITHQNRLDPHAAACKARCPKGSILSGFTVQMVKICKSMNRRPSSSFKSFTYRISQEPITLLVECAITRNNRTLPFRP